MQRHIHMSVGLEVDVFFLKQGALATPAWGCAAFFVDHTMTGQFLGTRRIAKRATHHTRMTGPSRQGGDMTIGSHSSARYLADDIQHGIAKCPCLFWRHPVWVVVHQ